MANVLYCRRNNGWEMYDYVYYVESQVFVLNDVFCGSFVPF